ncbi:MAG: DNA polymerase IV [Polyangia bacterium]
MPPRILLADADAFFVAVARLCDPQGAGRAPLLIVGGSATQRGVVCSASYEARRFGVRAAMPMAQAVRLCPQAMVVPVPRAACVDKSRQIAAVLRQFAPVLEAASIDEWYLDLSRTERLYGNEPLAATARRIREAVHKETRLSVSLGGGSNKLIAKLAVELAKRPPPPAEPGAFVVEPGDEAAFMTRFRLADLPLVGPRLQERLASVGLRTVAEALRYDEAALVGLLGEHTGRWLHGRLRGECADPVAPRERSLSHGREETFPTDLHSDDELGAELRLLLAEVCRELRRHGQRARTVTVKVKDADFTQRQRGRTLPCPVESERALGPIAEALLHELREARRVGVRLLGVSLSGLVEAGEEAEPATGGTGEQLALFASAPAPAAAPAPPVESERDRAVSRLRDRVQARFGSAALRGGGEPSR